jgi:inulin fructotransferase (DFA-I-forming)
MANVYDVTNWTISSNPTLTAVQDIGAIINDIIAHIKTTQTNQDSKPGAVIYVPPGDYSLKTRVTVDLSYLQIKGSGHGFTSLSIRYNSSGTSGWYEINPGGSHVKVENTDGFAEAFLVKRTPINTPRLSSIEFRDFCIDGVSFSPDERTRTRMARRVSAWTATTTRSALKEWGSSTSSTRSLTSTRTRSMLRTTSSRSAGTASSSRAPARHRR